MRLNLNFQIHTLIWQVPKLRLGNPYLASSCLTVVRKAGASKNPFPSWSLGTSRQSLVEKPTSKPKRPIKYLPDVKTLYVYTISRITHNGPIPTPSPSRSATQMDGRDYFDPPYFIHLSNPFCHHDG